MRPLHLLARLTLVASVLSLAACNNPTTPPPPPSCPYGIDPAMVRACGMMEVPLRHAEPGGATVKLPYVVFKGSLGTASRNATIVLQGGPGAPAAYVAGNLDYWLRQAKPQDDIIVFDQRGVGSSEPSLHCSLSPALSVLDLAAFRSQAQACLNDFKSRGINLADYNTRASADDVAFLAKKLGYAKLNLYGVSYGTRLAQEIVRRHPEIVRAQVLDGVLDPAESWAPLQTRYLHDTLLRFRTACVAAGKCPAGADLPAQVQRAADTLDSLNLRMDGANFGVSGSLPLNGDLLLFAVHNAGYSSGDLMRLPAHLARIEARQLETLHNTIWDAADLWRGLSLGMFLAVSCQDNQTDSASIRAAHAGLPPVFERRAALYEALAEACATAGLTTAPAALTPVSAKVPTLLISGRWDAVTPVHLAERVATRFTPSQHVVFEAGGHVNGFNDMCGALMMLSFLNNPATPLSTGCAATPLDFQNVP